jgi:hypothetical protein
MRITCKECRFWEESDGELGVCCRYPPAISRLEKIEAIGLFPFVHDTKWCGEARPREESSEGNIRTATFHVEFKCACGAVNKLELPEPMRHTGVLPELKASGAEHIYPFYGTCGTCGKVTYYEIVKDAEPFKFQGIRFVMNADRTVLDTKTGLVWRGDQQIGLTWREALESHALAKAAGGIWEIPTVGDLQTLIDSLRRLPATEFPFMSSDLLWSSDSVPAEDPMDDLFAVNFADGSVCKVSKLSKHSLRLVRRPAK